MNKGIAGKLHQVRTILTKGIWQPNATILMYHRVAGIRPDPWLLDVSPENFYQQMQILRNYEVIPMRQFIEDLKANKTRRTIVITFDDGYKDNFCNAMPLLQEAGLPATFFVSSAFTGKEKEFWNNHLDRILLTSRKLPAKLKVDTGNVHFSFDLEGDSLLTEGQLKQYDKWVAWEPPPTKRHILYQEIAKIMKSLPLEEEERLIDILYQWAGIERFVQPVNLMMNAEELKILSTDELFEIGAHTVSHRELNALRADDQYREITENVDFLENVTGKPVLGMSYPYGAYNADTIIELGKTRLQYACTTGQKPVHNATSAFELPRLRVRNWNGKQFKQRIDRWLRLGV